MSAESPKPLWYLAGLPGLPDITVMAQPVGEEVYFDYSGWPEDLTAVGVMQPEWVTPTGKHLRDPDGGKVTVVRRWRVISPEMPARRYCVVKRERPLVEIARWPGALEALQAYEKYRRWRDEPAKQPRPTLSLIVDNTRSALH